LASGKYKSKPQNQLEWLKLTRKLTRLGTTNVCEDVEKGETSYTVGGNASWYRPSGKHEGSSRS